MQLLGVVEEFRKAGTGWGNVRDLLNKADLKPRVTSHNGGVVSSCSLPGDAHLLDGGSAHVGAVGDGCWRALLWTLLQ